MAYHYNLDNLAAAHASKELERAGKEAQIAVHQIKYISIYRDPFGDFLATLADNLWKMLAPEDKRDVKDASYFAFKYAYSNHHPNPLNTALKFKSTHQIEAWNLLEMPQCEEIQTYVDYYLSVLPEGSSPSDYVKNELSKLSVFGQCPLEGTHLQKALLFDTEFLIQGLRRLKACNKEEDFAALINEDNIAALACSASCGTSCEVPDLPKLYLEAFNCTSEIPTVSFSDMARPHEVVDIFLNL